MPSRFLQIIIFGALLSCVLAQTCSCAPLRVPCDFTGIHCSLRDGCNSSKVNVALGKPTTFKSLYRKDSFYEGDLSHVGCLAVNGNIKPYYVSTKFWSTRHHANCYRSGEEDHNPSWEVDLGRNYTITEITIVVDFAHRDLMYDTDVFVDNVLCYKFTVVTILPPAMTHITCKTPLVGHLVRLSKSSYLQSKQTQYHMLSFCEVQVWVCNPGLYGKSCNKRCAIGCINCDNYYGVCASCKIGFYGRHCTDACMCGPKGCTQDGVCVEPPIVENLETARPAAFELQRSAEKCSCAVIGVRCDFKTLRCSDCGGEKVNVALGKPTMVKSLYKSDDYPKEDVAHMGCLAVNGNTDIRYRTTTSINGKNVANCYRSGERDLNPAWEVDLGRNYTITEISIFVEILHTKYLTNADIFVDNELCHRISKVALTALSGMLHIDCDTPLRGHIIRVSKSTFAWHPDSISHILSFCEVQVWVCKPGTYGKTCDKECSPKCVRCDNYYGTCLESGCLRGYFGKECTRRCGRCIDGFCEMDGSCTYGCSIGWYGDRCDKQKYRNTTREIVRGKQLQGDEMTLDFNEDPFHLAMAVTFLIFLLALLLALMSFNAREESKLREELQHIQNPKIYVRS